MDCFNCKWFKGVIKSDFNYVKCDYWGDDDISYRVFYEGYEVVICPKEPMSMKYSKV